MKENENKEPSSTAGAAKGGDTSKETIGSPVSTAVGEPVATSDQLTISGNDLMALARRLITEDLDDCDEEFVAGRAHGVGSLHAEILGLARLAAPTQVSAPQAVPEVLLNAKAVYDELYKTSSCSSLEEVSDVLDAIVRLIRADAPQASAAQEVRAVPEAIATLKSFWTGGWWMGVTTEDRERIKQAFKTLATPVSTSTAPAAMDEKGGTV